MTLTEKYRPKTFEDLIVKDEIYQYLSNLNEDNITNLLFYSDSPGTGKTSASLIIVKELNSEFIEINASKSTGIDIVREIIEPYTVTYSFNGNKKAIILSEAEQLSKPAQKSLKDILEREYNKNTYFILTTNHKEKIDKPLISRCVEIDFNNPPKHKIIERLQIIAEEENINLTKQDIDNLITYLYPDIRKMINSLEKIKYGLDIDTAIKQEETFYALYKKLISNRFTYKDFLLDDKAIPFIRYCFKAIINDYKVINKSKYLNLLAEAESKIMQGINNNLALISSISKLK